MNFSVQNKKRVIHSRESTSNWQQDLDDRPLINIHCYTPVLGESGKKTAPTHLFRRTQHGTFLIQHSSNEENQKPGNTIQKHEKFAQKHENDERMKDGVQSRKNTIKDEYIADSNRPKTSKGRRRRPETRQIIYPQKNQGENNEMPKERESIINDKILNLKERKGSHTAVSVRKRAQSHHMQPLSEIDSEFLSLFAK